MVSRSGKNTGKNAPTCFAFKHQTEPIKWAGFGLKREKGRSRQGGGTASRGTFRFAARDWYKNTCWKSRVRQATREKLKEEEDAKRVGLLTKPCWYKTNTVRLGTRVKGGAFPGDAEGSRSSGEQRMWDGVEKTVPTHGARRRD